MSITSIGLISPPDVTLSPVIFRYLVSCRHCSSPVQSGQGREVSYTVPVVPVVRCERFGEVVPSLSSCYTVTLDLLAATAGLCRQSAATRGMQGLLGSHLSISIIRIRIRNIKHLYIRDTCWWWWWWSHTVTVHRLDEI